MEKVGISELRGKLKWYIERMREGEVFEVHGAVIGALKGVERAVESKVKKPSNMDHVCKECGWVLIAGRCNQTDCKKKGKLQ